MALNEKLALQNIVALALQKDGHNPQVTGELLEQVSAGYPNEKDSGVPAPLSFLVWDLTENNKQAIDYRRKEYVSVREYVMGLFKQAEKILGQRKDGRK